MSNSLEREALRAALVSLADALLAVLAESHPDMQRPPPRVRSATVNERMLADIERSPEKIAWSARQWAGALGCSTSTVAATAAWKRIRTARILQAART